MMKDGNMLLQLVYRCTRSAKTSHEGINVSQRAWKTHLGTNQLMFTSTAIETQEGRTCLQGFALDCSNVEGW